MSFAEFWSRYPRRIAKKAAQKAYAKVTKDIPHAAVMGSLEIALETEWKGRKPEFVPHPATWLNRESFEERCEMLEDDECERPIGLHLCQECPVEHEWREQGPTYNMVENWLLACPVAQDEMRRATKKALVNAR